MIPAPRTARTCSKCSRRYTADEMRPPMGIGWDVTRNGWRCPACSRGYRARIDEMARAFLAAHSARRWLGCNEHDDGDECVICDVIARATELSLSAPER